MRGVGLANFLDCGCCRCEVVRSVVLAGAGVRLCLLRWGPSGLLGGRWLQVASAGGGAQTAAGDGTLLQQFFFGTRSGEGLVDGHYVIVRTLVKGGGWWTGEEAVEGGSPRCVGRWSGGMCEKMGKSYRGGESVVRVLRWRVDCSA